MKSEACKYVKKGDTVKILAGRERNKTGKILTVSTGNGRVFIEKLNLVKKHAKPSKEHAQGGIIEKEASVHASNVMLICPNCSKPTRPGFRRLEDGSKVRFCRKCDEQIVVK